MLGRRGIGLGLGKGEIDVIFTYNTQRYLLEAKWEKSKTNADALAKFQRRLEQRIKGTVGVFVSMAGYTSDALEGLDSGRQLDTLLFDAEHLEAMLSGFAPPPEILSRAHDDAAFNGKAYASVPELLRTNKPKPTVTFGSPDGVLPELSDPELAARILFAVPETNQIGVAVDSRGLMFVTTQDGIIEVNVSRKRAKWKLPIYDCHRSTIAGQDRLIVARKHGVAAFDGTSLKVLGGGFPGATNLILDRASGIWTLDNGTPFVGAAPTITRLGSSLGQETRHSIPYPSSQATAAAWLDDQRVIVVGGGAFCITALDGSPRREVYSSMSNCADVLAVDSQPVLTIGDATRLQLTDLTTGRHATLSTLPLRPSVFEVAQRGDAIYVASYVGTSGMTGAVLEVKSAKDLMTTFRNAFVRADSGNVSGYAAEIRRLEAVEVPVHDEDDRPRLEGLYQDAAQLVNQHLLQRFIDRVNEAGLDVQPDALRMTDGWPPIGYGGSASHRWWALKTRPGVSLRATIGVSHRARPVHNLNDLVITLIVAHMADESQHTILTRFVRFVPGDPGLVRMLENLWLEIESHWQEIIAVTRVAYAAPKQPGADAKGVSISRQPAKSKTRLA